MKYAVTTAPTVEPVTISEAKAHLRTLPGDVSEDDTIIIPLITAAREYCENITGRALATQTIQAYPETWGLWRLPRPPLAAVTSVKYYDTGGAEHILAATGYQVDTVDGQILVLEAPSATLRDLNPIEVEYAAGYTTCPKTIRQAMLLLIGHWYVNREAVVVGQVSTEVQITVDRLLRQWKVWWH